MTGPDTIVASEDYLEVRIKGNPPCNAEDNLHTELPVIEAGSGATKGVLD